MSAGGGVSFLLRQDGPFARVGSVGVERLARLGVGGRAQRGRTNHRSHLRSRMANRLRCPGRAATATAALRAVSLPTASTFHRRRAAISSGSASFGSWHRRANQSEKSKPSATGPPGGIGCSSAYARKKAAKSFERAATSPGRARATVRRRLECRAELARSSASGSNPAGVSRLRRARTKTACRTASWLRSVKLLVSWSHRGAPQRQSHQALREYRSKRESRRRAPASLRGEDSG